MHPFEQLPFETHPSDRRGYEIFKSTFWHSAQICNSCFSQVRTIGPEMTKRLDTSGRRTLADGMPLTMTINEWYDRTERGSQEHTTWDYNSRFGTCFCLECGTDCNGNHRNKSLTDLTPLAENIFRYTQYNTDHDLDGSTLAREICDLKQQSSAQGYETEILAIAFARALDHDADRAASPSASSPTTAD